MIEPARVRIAEDYAGLLAARDSAIAMKSPWAGGALTRTLRANSDEQRQVAEDTIADVDASGLWPGKAVTEISEAVPFWEAGAEHQDYLQRIPNGYTCHLPRPGWKLPHRETAA
jgi:Peptide methionine sulfoxide reductase